MNPSWHAVAAAAERFPGRVIARRLPVDYHAAREGLMSAMHELRPAACLCTGLAAGDVFRMERRARKPVQFADLPGPAELVGTWPWDRMERVLKEADVPYRPSDDAGRYVCESTYWSLLASFPNDGRPFGFLHVPAESATFPVERTAAAVHQIVADFLERAGFSGLFDSM